MHLHGFSAAQHVTGFCLSAVRVFHNITLYHIVYVSWTRQILECPSWLLTADRDRSETTIKSGKAIVNLVKALKKLFDSDSALHSVRLSIGRWLQLPFYAAEAHTSATQSVE